MTPEELRALDLAVAEAVDPERAWAWTAYDCADKKCPRGLKGCQHCKYHYLVPIDLTLIENTGRLLEWLRTSGRCLSIWISKDDIELVRPKRWTPVIVVTIDAETPFPLALLRAVAELLEVEG